MQLQGAWTCTVSTKPSTHCRNGTTDSDVQKTQNHCGIISYRRNNYILYTQTKEHTVKIFNELENGNETVLTKILYFHYGNINQLNTSRPSDQTTDRTGILHTASLYDAKCTYRLKWTSYIIIPRTNFIPACFFP